MRGIVFNDLKGTKENGNDVKMFFTFSWEWAPQV